MTKLLPTFLSALFTLLRVVLPQDMWFSHRIHTPIPLVGVTYQVSPGTTIVYPLYMDLVRKPKIACIHTDLKTYDQWKYGRYSYCVKNLGPEYVDSLIEKDSESDLSNI